MSLMISLFWWYLTLINVSKYSKKHVCYLSVLLTGDLQKSYSISGLPFLHIYAEFYKIFTFNAHNHYK